MWVASTLATSASTVQGRGAGSRSNFYALQLAGARNFDPAGLGCFLVLHSIHRRHGGLCRNHCVFLVRILDAKKVPGVSPVNARTLSGEKIKRLNDLEYESSPWTDDEIDILAAENADELGWEACFVIRILPQ